MSRRIAWLVLACVIGVPGVSTAQYFGKNKVQYTKFDFQVIKTEHFDIYFYERERTAAMDAARMAERAYARLSRILSHEFKERKPIILYASSADFEQTNTLNVGEGTGGVTDFFKHRAILPFTGSYSEFEHVLQHEMVHQFQYDVWSRGKAGSGLSTILRVNPPLWFAEGMAEYLSLGEITPQTGMWIRDAALEGDLPTLRQLERLFPYRYGHSIMAYIGRRWGDEAIGALLQGTVTGGIEGSFRRVLGVTVLQLIEQWRDDVQKQYLPEIKDRVKARVIASPVLTEERSDGRYHIAPALAPDGSTIAYLSEKDFFFIDLYLADANTGKVKRRLVKSTFDPNFRTLRFLKASMSWSPDGRFLAIAAGRKAQDDIVILNGEDGKEVGRIKVQLNGVTNPSWSPDGTQLVFTGYDGGISDLYLVNRDGSGFRRLTDDKYANLQPVWSPDGRTIAFVTDRGPETDFATLGFGNFRIALFHLDSGTEEVLLHMDAGKNMSPQWAPDGRSLAFVSDRTGISNIFIYDFDAQEIYKLTDLYTGAESITPESPVLSWAAKADRLAFVYYEKNNFDVYTLDDPRSLKGAAFEPEAAPQPEPVLAAAPDSAAVPRGVPGAAPPPRPVLAAAPDSAAVARGVLEAPPKVQPQVREGGTIYRTPRGFRAAGQVVAGVDSVPDAAGPISVASLLDSVSLSLPDTSEFSVGKYRAKLSPDYVSRPSIGYSRDTFGNGFYGGSAIVLTDMLNNHQLAIAAFLNGRIKEAQVFVGFTNLSRRLNWQVGISQDPVFYAELDQLRVDDPAPGLNTFVTNIRRLIIRQAFAQGFYPLNTFRRIELGMRLVNVEDDILALEEPYDPQTGLLVDQPRIVERSLGSTNFVQPSVAMVFDNTLFGWTAPFMGRRYRLELSRTVGGWDFTQGTFDYRRYDRLPGPFVLATRALYFGRIGPDADRFNVFLGSTDLLRGNTSGSYYRNECNTLVDLQAETGCIELDRMLGTQLAVASAELRFPILTPDMHFVPRGLPPIEGALFYDVGVAWNENSALKFSREAGDDPIRVRTPLSTAGLALRMNFFNFLILRADWNFPVNRDIGNYWTLSLGPAF